MVVKAGRTRSSSAKLLSSGRLAQSEEHHLHTVGVRGSRPLSPTKNSLVRGNVLRTRTWCALLQVHTKCTGSTGTHRRYTARADTGRL